MWVTEASIIFPLLGQNIPQSQKKKFIWLAVSECSAYSLLAPRQKQHDGKAWQRKATQPMAARKWREKI